MDFRYLASPRFPCSILLIVISMSCSSVRGVKKNAGEAVMYGMLYNDENVPVSGAAVFVDGKIAVFTDTQGRFILVSKQRKEFELSVEKPGYEKVTAPFRFEPFEVIHLTMMNAAELVNRAEIAMDEGRYKDAEAYCDRAIELDGSRIDAPYLKALSLARQGAYGASRLMLEALEKRIGERDYIKRMLEGLPE